MGQIQTLDELFSFLLRRFKVIAVVALLGTVVSLIYARSLPRLYTAASVLQVELPTLTEGGSDQPGIGAAQMLQAIEQDLTTREAMLAVIARHDLFADVDGLSEDRMAFLLRQAIQFQPITSTNSTAFGGGPSISALIISATWENPDLAARIANDFAQSLLDYSAAGSRERARATEDFFRTEVDRLGAEVATIEAAQTGFKNANADFLPEVSAARRDEMIALETDLRQSEREVATLNGLRTALVATGSDRATDKRQLADLDARLEVAVAQRNQITARRAELMAALAKAPEVEQGLSGFDRQLRQVQDKYDLAVTQLSAAQTEVQLAMANKTERFALLERANTPEDAVGTSRRKVAMAGTLASILAGLGLAFVFEQMFPILRTAEQLERQLKIRPIVSIPDLGPDLGKDWVAAPARLQSSPVLRLGNETARPALDLPRYLLAGAVLTLGLLGVAALLG